MAEKTIRHASFWYLDGQGRHLTALRGDTVDIPREEDIERGGRLGAFATPEEVRLGLDVLAAATAPVVEASLNPAASVMIDPLTAERRVSVAGSADPAIQSGMVEPAAVVAAVKEAAPPAEAPVPADPPAQSAAKAEWVDYAVSQGVAPGEAEALTKAELVEQYG